MSLTLDELVSQPNEKQPKILDYSKVFIETLDDFEKYFDKIPEYELPPEKVNEEDVRIRDTEFSFRYTEKEAKNIAKQKYSYGDPLPTSMKGVRLDDLAAVDISWRMLTPLRPKDRYEEGMFNRLVELGKLKVATRRLEAMLLEPNVKSAPGTQGNAFQSSMGIVVMKTKRGGTETRIEICTECGDEIQCGYCKYLTYDSFTRALLDPEELERLAEEEAAIVGGRRRESKTKLEKQQTSRSKPKGGGKLKLSGLKRGKRKKAKAKKEAGECSVENFD